MAQALAAAAPYLAQGLGSALSSLFSKKGAEDSSALQYHYQTLLNQQNYGYNTKLINMQNAFNERMMDKANQWNLERWNESVDLSNTAHQREMADLKSAGLNPILSANGGAAVVNPIQSAQASSGNSQLSSAAGMPEIDYVGALETANSIRNENKRVQNELDNSETQRDFTNTQRLNSLREIGIKESNSAAEVKKIENDIELANKRFEFEKQQESSRLKQDIKESDSRIKKNQSDIKYNQRRASGKSKSQSNNKSSGFNTGFRLGPLQLQTGINYSTGTSSGSTW